jgi:hypothetical protein
MGGAVGGGEEEAESKVYSADKRRAWAVGWARSVSEV